MKHHCLQVTAEIHVYQATAFQFAIAIFILANLVRSFTFSGFWLTFVWIELTKFAAFQVMSWATVSSFLQVAFIFDFRFFFKHWKSRLSYFIFSSVTDKDDETIIKGSKVFVFSMSCFILYDYFGYIFGFVPIMTKGVFAQHFGGPELIREGLRREKIVWIFYERVLNPLNEKT